MSQVTSRPSSSTARGIRFQVRVRDRVGPVRDLRRHRGAELELDLVVLQVPPRPPPPGHQQGDSPLDPGPTERGRDAQRGRVVDVQREQRLPRPRRSDGAGTAQDLRDDALRAGEHGGHRLGSSDRGGRVGTKPEPAAARVHPVHAVGDGEAALDGLQEVLRPHRVVLQGGGGVVDAQPCRGADQPPTPQPSRDLASLPEPGRERLDDAVDQVGLSTDACAGCRGDARSDHPAEAEHDRQSGTTQQRSGAVPQRAAGTDHRRGLRPGVGPPQVAPQRRRKGHREGRWTSCRRPPGRWQRGRRRHELSKGSYPS